jgi:chromosomal replication initiator protein
MENIQTVKRENLRFRAKCNKLENEIIRQANYIRNLENRLMEKQASGQPENMEDLILQAITQEYPYCHKSIIIDKSRNREYVIVRQLYQYFLRFYTKMPVKKIGLVTGNRDHSSVLHSLKEVHNWCLSDRIYKAKFERIEDIIKESFKTGDRIGDTIS